MEVTDDYGNRYSGGYKQLIQAKDSIKTITVKREALSIFGKSSSEYAFIGCCSTLETLFFESNTQLEVIFPYSFYSCTKLKSLSFTECNNLITIGSYSFYACNSVTHLDLPPSIKRISSFAFSKMSIDELIIRASLESMGEYAFGWNRELSNIIFEPNSNLSSIGDVSFESCNLLTEFFIPKKLVEFSAISVYNCIKMQRIILEEGNTVFTLIDGVLYKDSNKTLVYFPQLLNQTFIVPEFVENLDRYSFCYSSITSITLPKSLKTISYHAMRETNISEIIFPSSLKTISAGSFLSCSLLTNVTFHCNLSSFPGSAFAGCGFLSFNVPDGITLIDGLCFSGCTQLRNVSFPSSLSNLGGGVFKNCHPDLSIVFRKPSNWIVDSQQIIFDKDITTVISYFGSDESKTIVIPSSVETIKSNSFSNNLNVVGVSFPEDSQLTTIESNAFSGCRNLVYFSFTQKLSIIGDSAFLSCSSLPSFSFGKDISSIGTKAFYGCTSLQNVTMTSTCSQLFIYDQSFYNCQNLQTVLFQNGLSLIRNQCFALCYNLKQIEFPSSIQAIGEKAFQFSGIESITFPDSCFLESIPLFSFYETTSLQNIKFSNISSIGKFSFCYSSVRCITLPQSVKYLEDSCFKFCSKLENFTIPDSSQLSSIGFSIFERCPLFQIIQSSPDNNFIVENQALFNKDRTELVILPPASKVRFFYFPSTVTIIKQSSFLGCSQLESIIIPEESVKTIEASAFENCSNLRYITIPQSITKVGMNCFLGCTKLKCGIVIDNNSASFLKMLHELGKLPLSVSKECSAQFSCRPKSERSKCLSFLCAFIFVSVK